MLVATAGHIDHGKTSLVRALTGVETDRLPEEKARGISIDLGFAYWRPTPDAVIGFIDVPGHERFVRNMLAGVGGIDCALLVVAADDGVMPQTIEHLQILDLLGVSRGLIAITKCDRVAPIRVEAVRAQVNALVEPTLLAGSPTHAVSSVTGAGVADLAEALQAANDALSAHDSGAKNFRMAIDRAFTVTGAGTVAAGTVLDGAVEVGEALVLSPRGQSVRLRGLQSGGRSATRVEAGQRCAINLAGVDLADVRRGDWLTAPAQHAPTSRIEARLRVLPTRSAPLRHHTPVHLHIGTADIGARVLIPGQKAIAPGADAIVHLALDAPTLAATGDHLIIRDQAGRASVGGGKVIDPFAFPRRNHAARAPVSTALEAPDAERALAALLAIPGHEVNAEQFQRSFNLTTAHTQAIYAQVDAVQRDALLFASSRARSLSEQIMTILDAFHHDKPDAEGMTLTALKKQLSEPLSTEAFLALLRDLQKNRQVVSLGASVKRQGHAVAISPADLAMWRKVLPWLEERGAAPFTVRELTREARTSEPVMRALLHRKRSLGEVWRVTEERYLLREQVAALAARAETVAREAGEAGFSAAQYRDAIGTGRTWAIHVLEFFDSIGVTRRKGDLRKVKPEYAIVVGDAAPYTPHQRGDAGQQ